MNEPLSRRKRRRQSRVGERINKGLRHYSIKVCEKLSQMGTTTYNEIANALVRDFLIETKFPVEPGDEKNIRRRIYDALNVLCAMEIIYKDKKKIRWKGLEHTSGVNCDHLESAKKTKRERIQRKKDLLSDMTLQFIALQNLIERNGNDVALLAEKSRNLNCENATMNDLTENEFDAHRRVNEKLHIPFIIVNCKPDTEVECEMSNDLDEVCFDYNNAFQIHDDNHVLRQLGLVNAESKPLHDLIPVELRRLLSDTRIGRALKSQESAYRVQQEHQRNNNINHAPPKPPNTPHTPHTPHTPPPPPPKLGQHSQINFGGAAQSQFLPSSSSLTSAPHLDIKPQIRKFTPQSTRSQSTPSHLSSMMSSRKRSMSAMSGLPEVGFSSSSRKTLRQNGSLPHQLQSQPQSQPQAQTQPRSQPPTHLPHQQQSHGSLLSSTPGTGNSICSNNISHPKQEPGFGHSSMNGVSNIRQSLHIQTGARTITPAPALTNCTVTSPLNMTLPLVNVTTHGSQGSSQHQQTSNMFTSSTVRQHLHQSLQSPSIMSTMSQTSGHATTLNSMSHANFHQTPSSNTTSQYQSHQSHQSLPVVTLPSATIPPAQTNMNGLESQSFTLPIVMSQTQSVVSNGAGPAVTVGSTTPTPSSARTSQIHSLPLSINSQVHAHAASHLNSISPLSTTPRGTRHVQQTCVSSSTMSNGTFEAPLMAFPAPSVTIQTNVLAVNGSTSVPLTTMNGIQSASHAGAGAVAASAGLHNIGASNGDVKIQF